MEFDKDLRSIQEVRNLVARAKAAQAEFASFSQSHVDQICKAIADACEGKIGVESDTGLGAKFWFWLPCDIKTMQPQ